MCVGDGLAANRQMFRLHAPKNSEIVHKTSNPFAAVHHTIFFFSDPPHLLKTFRNCFATKNRILWVRLATCTIKFCDLLPSPHVLQFEHPICWSFLVDLYRSSRASAQSLTVVPKLKYEHTFLTSYSKMRGRLGCSGIFAISYPLHTCIYT